MTCRTSPDFSLEDALATPAGGVVAGIDEAGRGPLAGPVVAACVMLSRTAYWLGGLRDSKRLGAARRESLAALIRAEAHHGIGLASAQEIDTFNIHHATLLAMRRAFDAMTSAINAAVAGGGGKGAACSHVLVDGRFVPLLPCPAQAVVRGDACSLSIAAASIVAKVHRDALMMELHRRWPAYGFDRHAGYPTAAHLAALRQHGAIPEHRQSFRPVRAQLAQDVCP
jgi:ribonuclease HII